MKKLSRCKKDRGWERLFFLYDPALEPNHPLLHWKVRIPLQTNRSTNHPENHLHHLSRDFPLPHQHPSSCLNKRTCIHSLPPPYFQEQLWSYWTSSQKGLERWLFASPSKGIVHILLYIFLILFFYSYCIYITATLAHKKPCFKIHKVILLFNSHFLIAFVLATFNTSLGQPSLTWYITT